MKKSEETSPEVSRVEMPLPEEKFRQMGLGSRTTFFRWEREGLRVLRVGGRRFILPSDLRTFLEKKDKDARAGKPAC